MADSRKRNQRKHTQLIALRINKGLGRPDLARRIGVSAETIRLVELGFVPGPRIQYALALEFGLVPLELWPVEVQRIERVRRVAAA